MSGLPIGWTEAAVLDLLEPLSDGRLIHQGWSPRCETVPSSDPSDWGVLKTTAIQDGSFCDEHNKKLPDKLDPRPLLEVLAGDLVMTCAGPRARCGVPALVRTTRPRLMISGKMYRMRPSRHAEPGYLEAALRTSAAQLAIDQLKTGMSESGMNLTHDRFATLRVPVAPAAEQRRIVAKLDALTARTARARADLDRIPALAARYKLALLRTAMRGGLTESWRRQADLEPALALVERTPAPPQGRGGREATTGVVPGQAALSVNDPGTPAPDGWAWTPLLRIARQETGHTPSRSVGSYWGGEVPWIGIRDAGAHHGRTIERTLQTITADGLANSSARVLPARTVCLSRTASVGYVTIMARPMATSQDFATWTCSGALEPEFLMYALMAEDDDIRAFGEGSTHTTIYFPEIRALHICLPPLAEQQEIIRRVRAGLTEIDRLTAEAAAARRLLDGLDQAILAKAFRGELVPQDPADEPASVLLERIRAERAAAPKPKRGRRKAAA